MYMSVLTDLCSGALDPLITLIEHGDAKWDFTMLLYKAILSQGNAPGFQWLPYHISMYVYLYNIHLSVFHCSTILSVFIYMYH